MFHSLHSAQGLHDNSSLSFDNARQVAFNGQMDARRYVSGDLAGILLNYIGQNRLTLPEMQAELLKYNSNNRLSYEAWCGYLGTLSEVTDNPCIGIELGRSVELGHSGILGYLALSCETTGEAVLKFKRFQALLYGGEVGNVLSRSQGKSIRYVWPASNAPYDTWRSDEVLVAGLDHFVRKMTGREDLSAETIGFKHKKPVGSGNAYDYLNCPVKFEQDDLYIDILTEHLTLPISTKDPSLKRLLDQQAEALLRVLPNQNQFEQDLKKLIIRSMQDGEPTLDNISSQLNISSRTLHRKLEDIGVNFKTLLQQTRRELAIEYLREGQLSMSEIALLLGYSEQSAFSRAFKGWTGVSPKAFLQA